MREAYERCNKTLDAVVQILGNSFAAAAGRCSERLTSSTPPMDI